LVIKEVRGFTQAGKSLAAFWSAAYDAAAFHPPLAWPDSRRRKLRKDMKFLLVRE